MRMSVLTGEGLKRELEDKGVPAGTNIEWVSDFEELTGTEADLYVDLLFEKTDDRIRRLAKLSPRPVMINAVINTVHELGQPFLRINAWPGFLNRGITEVAVSEAQMALAASVFETLNWPFRIVPDQPGLISARVVSMIINEAYFALDDGISTKHEIDIAMKLGTNYPFGPFEWSEKIGLKNIHALLTVLSNTDMRYMPAEGMGREIGLPGGIRFNV